MLAYKVIHEQEKSGKQFHSVFLPKNHVIPTWVAKDR